jgi:hypothetical protein
MFSAFDRIPVAQHLIARCRIQRAEHVGMAADQFLRHGTEHIASIEASRLTRHFTLHQNVDQHITQFFDQRRIIVGVERLQRLVHLFEQRRPQ